jgi:hypothetical protein
MANEDIDLLIAKVNLANLESDLRNRMKPRTKASDTSKMNKLYKPKSSPGPISDSASNVREGRSTDRTPMLNRANAREDRPAQVKPTRPVAESTGSTKSTSKAQARVKDTSFNKGGLIPALTSGNAKKFKNTFNKKGLLPALRGK